MSAPTALTPQQEALAPLVENHLVRPWPAFGKAVGAGSPSAAHRALVQLEAAGQITVVRTGHRLLVPTASILKLLSLTHAQASEIVYGTGAAPAPVAADQTGSEVVDTVSATPAHKSAEALDSTSDGAK